MRPEVGRPRFQLELTAILVALLVLLLVQLTK